MNDPLIAKLNAYGFQYDALKLLRCYLSKRWHRTKVNKSFSSRETLFNGVPQESVFFYNIYFNDFLPCRL